jgi:hypothetical protein
MRMKKEQLAYVRIAAVSLSCLVAALTLCNLLTVVTHGIDFEVPEQEDFTWAIDPVEKRILFLTNFSVKNHGTYDIEDIDVNARLVTDDGRILLGFSKVDMVVSRGTNKRFEVMIPLDLDEVPLSDWFSLLYKDTTINLILDIDADYMFGLVHVTVDEVLSYQWHAPFSSYDGDFMSPLFSIAEMVGFKLSHSFGEVERAMIEQAMLIEDFEFVTNDGYAIWVNTSDVSEGIREMACEIIAPIEDLAGKLDIGFKVHIGFPNDVPYVMLQKVSVGYVGE